MIRRTRITFVIPTMKAGGTERQLLYLMRGLAGEFDVSLVCTRGEGGFIGEARRLASHVRILDYSSGWDFRVVNALRRFIHVQRPEIVQTYLFGFDYWAVRAARQAEVPVVFTARRELAAWQRARHLWLVRRANRLADGAIANSAAAAEFAAAREQWPTDFYQVIPNGIDVDTYRAPADRDTARKRFGLPLERPVVGIAANFTPVKDHALFVETAVALKQRVPEAHFFLLGMGPLRDEIRQALARRVGPESFTIRHSLDEMPEAYAAMDVSVLCSQREGSPNAVLESMAAGVPVVAASVGGVPELFAGAFKPYLVSERTGGAFAAPIAALLTDEALRRRTASEANRLADAYSIDAMVAAHRNLYLATLDRIRAGAA
ncbi:MAG: glycosyltransferase [Candidatus Hydrogenedens sp.]|nr:glycosyltransferase [Candidatus Hydrogenedens sp.]